MKVKDALTTNLLSRVPECIAFIDEYVPVAAIVVVTCASRLTATPLLHCSAQSKAAALCWCIALRASPGLPPL